MGNCVLCELHIGCDASGLAHRGSCITREQLLKRLDAEDPRNHESTAWQLRRAVARLFQVGAALSWGEMELEFRDALVKRGEAPEEADRLASLAFP